MAKGRKTGGKDFKKGESGRAGITGLLTGRPDMKVYRAVQDALDNPDLIPGEKEALIARVFKTISDGVNRRDELGRPDNVTFQFCQLVSTLYFGKNGDGRLGAESDPNVFRVRVVYDDQIQTRLNLDETKP
jgi:hypothetical protein